MRVEAMTMGTCVTLKHVMSEAHSCSKVQSWGLPNSRVVAPWHGVLTEPQHVALLENFGTGERLEHKVAEHQP